MNKCETSCPMKDLGLLLMRLILAVVFMYHGSQKVFGMFDGKGMFGEHGFIEGIKHMGMPVPVVSAWAAALAELVGGALLGIGLLTRLAAVPMAFTMAVAVFRVHWGTFSGQKGLEYPLTLGVFLVALILTGPGKFSVDGCLRGRCCRGEAESPPTGP